MKLNTRHAIAKTIPAVARKKKMTVTEGCTVTTSYIGTPSYGAKPPGKVEVKM